MIPVYASMAEAEMAAPVGHYVMFRDAGGVTEWCVMSPEGRDAAHAGWRTWARKEAPQS